MLVGAPSASPNPVARAQDATVRTLLIAPGAVDSAMTTSTAGLSEPRTYVELMGDVTADPCALGAPGGDPTLGYASIFTRWRVSDASPTPEQVHRDLLTDFSAPVGAVGFFVSNGVSKTGILKVTHGYGVYAGFPTTTDNRGKTFGYVGDVVGGLDIDTFELDLTHLARTVEVRCCTKSGTASGALGRRAR